MKQNKILGWSILIILSLIPVFLLFYFGPDTQNLFTYSELTHKLAEIAALVAITMFSLTFILSMRLKFIEDIFGGLDKVYIAHGILGGTALILILFHPILLVLRYIPSNLYQAALYLLPSKFWSVNFGIIAILGFIGLIFFTLYTNIKYHKWKISHKFLGLVFIFALLHMFLVKGVASRDYIFNGYYLYSTLVAIVGLSGFSYTLFLKKSFLKEAIYKVDSINKVKETYEFTFIPDTKPLEYKSGQFIFIRFYNKNLTKEAHPFSIASSTNDKKIKIIVKNLGDFTKDIHNVKVGDKVAIEGPYGRFNFNEKVGLDKVWIAGGIGITPFIGMAEDIKEKKIKDKIDLYYSVKTDDELIASDNFKEIEKTHKNFRFFPWITNDKGYLTVKFIMEKSGNLKDKEFYLCGPTGFKKSLKDALIKEGVSEEKIHEEEFNFK